MNQNPESLSTLVHRIVDETPVIDMHTHLFAPEFGALGLSGIDALVTYHYLVAEVFRSSGDVPERFLAGGATAQADAIWEALFVRNSPLSEATRGVVGVLSAFGLDSRAPDLSAARQFFDTRDPRRHLDEVLALANVSLVVMTNDPFDEREAEVWTGRVPVDPRFRAALRLDKLLESWPEVQQILQQQGFEVGPSRDRRTTIEVARWLTQWIHRMRPLYLAVSLTSDFTLEEDSPRAWLIRDVVLPVCREHALPFAMMIGVRRAVNPALGLAGDGLGRADVRAVERICVDHPHNRFLVTMLSRENQHELCVVARKFSNLMPFGCWWFLNNPSIVEEITDERLELLGLSFIPQHSDARILEQLVYKWRHSRRVIADRLSAAYERLAISGRVATEEEIRRDVERLFSGNFAKWVGL